VPVKTTIQHRRDTAAAWTTQLLAPGEVGLETDTGKFKVGTGAASAAWNTLPYAPAGLSDTATSISGGSTGAVLYQSASSTTAKTLAIGAVGTVLVSTGTVPSWAKLTLSTTTFNSPTSADILALLSDETGTGLLVFNTSPAITSPALTTPTVTSAGAILKGTSTGSTTLVSGLTGATSYTVTLPAETGTLLTAAAATATYLPLAGGAVSGALSTVAITSSAQVQGATLRASGITTAGVVVNGATGILGSVASIPVANGGTGGTSVPTARQGMRIFVQSAEPTLANTGTTPVADDLWFY
jgi:hypothetical protein